MRKEVPAHTTYTCDRCGIKASEPWELKHWRVLERRALGGDTSKIMKTSDLCPNCADSHRDWLDHFKGARETVAAPAPHDFNSLIYPQKGEGE